MDGDPVRSFAAFPTMTAIIPHFFRFWQIFSDCADVYKATGPLCEESLPQSLNFIAIYRWLEICLYLYQPKIV